VKWTVVPDAGPSAGTSKDITPAFGSDPIASYVRYRRPV
jgi:hypothetical protein